MYSDFYPQCKKPRQEHCMCTMQLTVKCKDARVIIYAADISTSTEKTDIYVYIIVIQFKCLSENIPSNEVIPLCSTKIFHVNAANSKFQSPIWHGTRCASSHGIEIDGFYFENTKSGSFLCPRELSPRYVGRSTMNSHELASQIIKSKADIFLSVPVVTHLPSANVWILTSSLVSGERARL